MNHQCFNEPINPDEWLRYDIYAQRVRVISFSSRVHSSAYSVLASSRPDVPLLPNLCEFKWYQHQADDQDMTARLFLAPTLQRVSIDWYGFPESGPPQSLDNFLRVLASNSRFLTHLSVKSDGEMHPISALATFENLHFMKLASPGLVDNDLYQVLSHMPRLFEVHLDLSGSPPLNIPHIASFPTLTNIKIRGHLPQIIDFLRHVSSLSLLDVAIQTSDEDAFQDGHWLSSIVLSTLAHKFGTTLQNVLFDSPLHGGIEIRQVRVMDIVGPLLQAHSLKRLCVSLSHIRLSLSDDDIADMASAWPCLQSLILPEIQTGTRPGIQSLESFAKHCPQLENLSISADANLTTSHPVSISHGLGQLSLIYSDIAHSGSVAEFLARLFPAIERFSAWNDESDKRDKWKNVVDIYKAWQHETGKGELQIVTLMTDRNILM